MAIQHRHGDFKDFDPNKMVTAELAVVTSGDPASPTGRTLYICFAPGIVKRIVSYEDFENELQNATEEIQQAFTQEIRTAITNSIAATNAANEAKKAADLAAEAARKAAEAAGAYVLGDISGKTVKFTEAEGRENINTGESTATMFGKIKKWFADLKNIAFTGNYSDLLNVPEIVNNRTTTKEGTVLDGRQGKAIQDEFDKLNTNTIRLWTGTLYPSSTVGTYNYANFSARADDCAAFILYLTIAEDKIYEVIIPHFTGTITKNVYLGANYNIKVSINLSTTTHKIGVKIDKIAGWTYNTVHIDCLYGILGTPLIA